MTTSSSEIKNTWWKWGDPQKSLHLNDFPKFRNYLEEKWKVTLKEDLSLPDYHAAVKEADFSTDDFKKTFPELKPGQFSNNKEDRIIYAFGKSYHDAIKILTQNNIETPDFILYPESITDLLHILQQANTQNINIITFSGGSSVTGALAVEQSTRRTCTLNMQRMKRLIKIDEASHTATFEAGIFGPELESHLNKQGFTLGHFPQSFEYSTLGGWLATRSGGQESGQYGKIEDMALGLKIVTPAGVMEHADYPRHACGIDTYPLFIGSEGTLGVIAEAKMRIHKKPAEYKWVTALFKDMDAGIAGLQKIIQTGIHPGIVRLSDSVETRFLSMMSRHEKSGFQKIMQNLMKSYLKSKGFSAPCILMMRFAINNASDTSAAGVAAKMAKTNGAQLLPASSAGNWEENRFTLPYLRETLIQHRIMIDTFETVTYWKNVPVLYHQIKEEVKKESDYFEKGGLLFAHISHVYETGACLYFTMICPQERDNELNQWKAIKEIVTNAVVKHGGAVSHHHGIGKDHRKWYLEKLSENERKLLLAIKRHLDPNNILNPGKLYDKT